MHISSYSTIYAIGHRAIADIFKSEVSIEEKVDGSQFSMCKVGGVLSCRSRSKDILIDAPEKMFIQSIEVAKSLDLHEGWVYRGEYLSKPKHNTLAYSRHPKNHIILFDVMIGPETFLEYDEKVAEANRLGLECVPLVYEGMVTSTAMFNGFLERESILGGCKIEGVVVKNYLLFTQEKKVAMGKYVSEAFKEKHGGEWRKLNPTPQDVVQSIISELKTDARWAKAVQHLREEGKLENSPKDIGLLVREVPEDILKDSKEDIRDRLFKHFWPQIQRGVIAGVPEWYKQQLCASAFENGK